MDRNTPLTYRQAGEELGISERTIRRMARDGEIQVLRFRGALRIPAWAVERLRAAQGTPREGAAYAQH